MSISFSALKGFLLEEVLAKLLENCGYTLITDEIIRKDKDSYPEFVRQGNGWNIRGRGGTHQADVLGQFHISIPFNYPVRLFLEAKFRRNKTGIDVVRSGIGILTDLNANYQTIDLKGDKLFVQRFNYQYAIFSTSGFSENAIKLAIAYKITLIDLSGREYRSLLNTIGNVAEELLGFIEAERFSLNEIRAYIRSYLFPENRESLRFNNRQINNILLPLFSEVDNYGDLYLASVNSPFSILLKPSSPENIKKFFSRNRESNLNVDIRWGINESSMWRIIINNELGLELTFYLPELLREYIFKNHGRPDTLFNARNAKETYFNKIVFYMKNEEKFITLKYRVSH